MNDYQKKVDSIHLTKEKKDELQKLYATVNKPNSLRSSHRLRIALVAICASFALAVIATSHINSPGHRDAHGTKGHNNSFLVYAQAAQIKPGMTVSIDKTDIFDSYSGNPDSGEVDCHFKIPFTFRGENIKTITYQTNIGDLKIEMPNSPDALSEKDLILEDKNASIPFSLMEKEDIQIFYHRKCSLNQKDYERFWYFNQENQSQNTKEEIERKKVLDQIYKDFILTCTATFEDGSTQSKNFVIETKLMTAQQHTKDYGVLHNDIAPNEKIVFEYWRMQ